MTQPVETEESIENKHEELCTQLNVDAEAMNQSWSSYKTISHTYSLDGDPLHWLGCALYVACRRSLTPVVGRSGAVVEGNCVSLTKLMRLCNISLIQFFNTIKKWIEMCSMPDDFRVRMEKLEKNFAVSTVLFQKYKPIFTDLFVGLDRVETPKSNRGSKKTKLTPCSVNAIFEFCWCLFVCVKGEFPYLSDDLVNMYHLLLSCVDLVFANAFMAQRSDLINPAFEGLPVNWSAPNFEMPNDAPCVIAYLCKKHYGLCIEARSIKQYTWKEVMNKFFAKGILKGDETKLTGVLDLATFDYNLKSLNKVYETFVLSVGEFDERIFLGEQETVRSTAGDEILKALNSHTSVRSLGPDTPLTGRRYLKRSEPLTPVTTATRSVAKLHDYLAGYPNSPTASLMTLVKDCIGEPMLNVLSWEKEMAAQFVATYSPLSSEEMAGNRLNLAEAFYFRLLEQVLRDEVKKKPQAGAAILQRSLMEESFHKALFACCVEIVMYAYSFQNARFPWVLKCFQLDAFYFCKIIEIVVLVIKDKLTRDVVKHLNAIEEEVLECLAWKSDSTIWEWIDRLNGPLPQWSEVCIQEGTNGGVPPNNGVPGNNPNFVTYTPPLLPTTRRLQHITVNNASGGIPPSPLSSTADRFLLPGAPSDVARRQLFNDSNIRPGQSLLNQNANNAAIQYPPGNGDASNESNRTRRIIKGGSLGLFLRKFYNLAVVRMRVLCNDLGIGQQQELIQKIWTCLEHTIIHQTQLMRDRHFDQILMCAVYVICKVSNSPNYNVEQTFTEIMRCYRFQPQSTRHVYRSVLLSVSSQDSPPTPAVTNANEAGAASLPVSPVSPGRLPNHSHGPVDPQQQRGDLIVFYNTVYVRSIQQFVQRFNRPQPEELNLSPVPPDRRSVSAMRGSAAAASGQRVSQQHLLFVHPLENLVTPPPAASDLSYCFSRSPAKDLHEINYLMSRETFGIKRVHESVLSEAGCSVKRPAIATPTVARKLHHLVIDRQAN